MIRRNKLIQQRTNFSINASMLGFCALLTTLLLFGFSQAQEKQIRARYYADFGLYSDSQALILKKNDQFVYTYYGCSQNNGALKGKWVIIADTLKLESKAPLVKEFLSSSYRITANELISLEGKDTLHKH